MSGAISRKGARLIAGARLHVWRSWFEDERLVTRLASRLLECWTFDEVPANSGRGDFLSCHDVAIGQRNCPAAGRGPRPLATFPAAGRAMDKKKSLHRADYLELYR